MVRAGHDSLIGEDKRRGGQPQTNVEGYEDLVYQTGAVSIRTLAVSTTPQ